MKKIIVYSALSGRTIGEYASVRAACKDLKLNATNVVNCLKRRQRTVSGYYVKYIEEVKD